MWIISLVLHSSPTDCSYTSHFRDEETEAPAPGPHPLCSLGPLAYQLLPSLGVACWRRVEGALWGSLTTQGPPAGDTLAESCC